MNQAVLAPDFPRISEVPFDSTSKRMVTVHRPPQGRTMAFIKGSPGQLIAASSAQVRAAGVSPLTPDDRRRWEETNQELAGAALRVLGLAYRELPEGYNEGDFARDLIFVGLVGMSDPLRDEAKAAIAICREAGIRTVMITGDQPPTASEIARQLGIDRDSQDRPLRTVHGRELTGLDAEGWKRAVADAAVFARVSPEHKLQIVEALQQQGHVVAMTGDGVNDAPALKKADIGIAMGIKGTEITKENADMVITDVELYQHRRCRRAGADHLRKHSPFPALPTLLQLFRNPNGISRSHDRLAAATGRPTDLVAQLDHRHLPRLCPSAGTVGA